MSSTMTQAVSELSIPVPWGQIRGKVWGPDDGRPVLCLHGLADNCGTFNPLIPLLPKDCRYVAVDLPGHGLSSHRPPGTLYTFPSLVVDIRRIVDALQWTKFSIIGHSMGGNAAAMFSAVYPDMVDALVLLDIFGFILVDPRGASQEMRQMMDEVFLFEKKTEEKQKVYTLEEAAERMLAANPTLSEQSVHILLERGLVQVEGGFVFSRDLRVHSTNIMRVSLEQALEMQSNIQARVLVLLGDKGFGVTSIPPHRQEGIATLVQGYCDRNHTVIKVSGDHYVHLNNPEVIAPFVFDFLQPKVLPQQQA